jgi:hypothetical protein
MSMISTVFSLEVLFNQSLISNLSYFSPITNSFFPIKIFQSVANFHFQLTKKSFLMEAKDVTVVTVNSLKDTSHRHKNKIIDVYL